MRINTRKSGARAAPARPAEGIDVLAELAALKAMTVPELQGKWRVMFGEHAQMDLVQLAIPRRTYAQSHIDYVIEVCRHVALRAGELRGMRIVSEPPQLRHFTATFAPA